MISKVFGVFGIIIMTISLPFVAMAAHDAITGGDGKTERGVLLGLVVLFGALSIWGYRLAAGSFGWKLWVPKAPRINFRSEREKEQAVLALAANVGGRVTMVEVAGKCDLTIGEAETILNNLAAHGAVEMLIAEDGTVVYDFDILTKKEKE